MVAPRTSMIVASTTRAIVAPAMIAWLACRHGFCHRVWSALSASSCRRSTRRYARTFRKAAGVHPPTNVPGAYGAPGLPGAPLFYVDIGPRLAGGAVVFGAADRYRKSLPACLAFGRAALQYGADKPLGYRDEALCRPERAGNPRPGDHQRGGGFAHLSGLRR